MSRYFGDSMINRRIDECDVCGKKGEVMDVESCNGDIMYYCNYNCAAVDGEVCPVCSYLINEECYCEVKEKSMKMSKKERLEWYKDMHSVMKLKGVLK